MNRWKKEGDSIWRDLNQMLIRELRTQGAGSLHPSLKGYLSSNSSSGRHSAEGTAGVSAYFVGGRIQRRGPFFERKFPFSGRSNGRGAGTLEHLREALVQGRASAVLAASIFHYRQHTIREVKEFMQEQGLGVRLE